MEARLSPVRVARPRRTKAAALSPGTLAALGLASLFFTCLEQAELLGVLREVHFCDALGLCQELRDL